MSKYRITLTPVDKFFFGGDMTFQVGDDEKDFFNRQYASYIIQSTKFPQQTSLLGMLRFLILRNAGEEVFRNNKIIDDGKASELIGPKSFSVNDGTKENTFGYIKGISHVRILRIEKDSKPDSPKETELEFAPLFGAIDFSKGISGTYNLGILKIPRLTDKQYNAKDGLGTMLTDGKNKYKMADIFVEDRRIGIARSIVTGKTDDDGALFKQISYRFNDKNAKHCFVFYAEVGGIDLKLYDKHLVTVGGDNSQFIIGITDDENSSSQIVDNDSLAISLLSPAFINRQDVKDNTRFAITQLMPFRFLTDREGNNDKDGRSYHIINSKLKRSERYELYAPGTVFYFKNDTQRGEFIKILEARKDFRQIGYNEYKPIK
jgi:CRISPR-associated protein Cmr3